MSLSQIASSFVIWVRRTRCERNITRYTGSPTPTATRIQESQLSPSCWLPEATKVSVWKTSETSRLETNRVRLQEMVQPGLLLPNSNILA
ncbi:hypothetical protein BJX99DRAFT_223276 [Aspergillus californicus]